MSGDPLERPLDQLQAELSGELEAWMGVRSWMGPMVTYGPMGASPSSDQRTDPSSAARRAASVSSLVRGVLRCLPYHHTRLLQTYYMARGPNAPWGLRPHFGLLAAIVAKFDRADELRAILELPKRDKEQKRALKVAEAEAQRALEKAHVAYMEAYEQERAQVLIEEQRRRDPRARRLRYRASLGLR